MRLWQSACMTTVTGQTWSNNPSRQNCGFWMSMKARSSCLDAKIGGIIQPDSVRLCVSCLGLKNFAVLRSWVSAKSSGTLICKMAYFWFSQSRFLRSKMDPNCDIPYGPYGYLLPRFATMRCLFGCGFEVASPNWNAKWGQSTLDDRNIEAVLLNQKNGWGEWNASNDLQHIHSWCINVSCLSSRNSWNVLVVPASLPMASDDIIREEVAAGFVYNIRRLGVLNRLIFKEVPEDIVDFVICQFI